MISPLAKLNQLRSFLARVDEGALFDDDPQYYSARRRELGQAVIDLLLHHRPFLEEETGLLWPYRELAKRVDCLADWVRQGQTPLIRKEARLFHAFLPFPGQWRALLTAGRELEDDPELKAFLLAEQGKITDKIRGKQVGEYRLRHCCQILKRPNLPREKGILRIFSRPYLFADAGLLQRVNRLYIVYMEPPWAVLARHPWLRAYAQMEDPAVIGVGGREDEAFLAGQSGIVTTRLAHGDFLEEGDAPAEGKKEFDLVFNGTFDEMERKRHVFLLDLLSRPPLDNLTALFLGRGSAGNIDIFRQRVKERGLDDRVTLLTNLRRREVPEHLARCRVGVLTSQNENGCRSVYEYLRADLPCVVSSSMAGLNFDLITQETGMAVSDGQLPNALRYVLQRRESFSPRAWFLRHSGSRLSSLRLNGEMKNLFRRLGYDWREDIVPLRGSGATRYLDETGFQLFRDEFERLLAILQPCCPVRLSL
jgi:hypothetical protein